MKDTLFWIAQGVGCLAMLALVLSYQQKKREHLILCKLCADICWSVNYLLVGGWGGMISNSVGICRECVFFHRGKKKWASSSFWPVFFILVGWATFFTVRLVVNAESFSFIHVLPIAATTCATLSFWCKSPNLTKVISIPASGSFLVYNLLIGNYIGVFNESVVLVSIGVGLLRGWLESRAQETAGVSDRNEVDG